MQKNGKKNFVATISGLAVGTINGMLGAGGGMLVVPVYQNIFQHNSKKAHATAIITILPVCVISAIGYICAGVVEIKPLFLVMIGSVIGAIIGTFLLKKIRSNIITIIFYCLMFISGIFMFL